LLDKGACTVSKIAVIASARTASTRLPNKVIFELGGKPAFVQAIERVTSVVNADYVVVACSVAARDDPICLLAKHYGIDCFRGPEEDVGSRLRMCGEWLGLKDDDWLLGSSADQVLALTKWLPWGMEQLQKQDCAHIRFVSPPNTLPWALKGSGLTTWGLSWCNYKTFGADKGTHYATVRTAYHVDDFRQSGGKVLIVHWPEEYLRPWPWGSLLLDHEVQAVVLKEVYRRLYKGAPIDPFDVYQLFRDDPHLAVFMPVDIPRTMNLTPDPKGSPYLRNVRLNADYVEVTWKGGNDVTSKCARQCVQKNTGGKNVKTNN